MVITCSLPSPQLHICAQVHICTPAFAATCCESPGHELVRAALAFTTTRCHAFCRSPNHCHLCPGERLDRVHSPGQRCSAMLLRQGRCEWRTGGLLGVAPARGTLCHPQGSRPPLPPILHAGCITPCLHPSTRQPATPRPSGQVGACMAHMGGGQRGGRTGWQGCRHASCLLSCCCSHILLCSRHPI